MKQNLKDFELVVVSDSDTGELVAVVNVEGHGLLDFETRLQEMCDHFDTYNFLEATSIAVYDWDEYFEELRKTMKGGE